MYKLKIKVVLFVNYLKTTTKIGLFIEFCKPRFIHLFLLITNYLIITLIKQRKQLVMFMSVCTKKMYESQVHY